MVARADSQGGFERKRSVDVTGELRWWGSLPCFGIEMVEDLADDFLLGDEGEKLHRGIASGAGQGVDLVGDRFILHLLQRIWSKRDYVPVEVYARVGALVSVDRCRVGRRAIDLGRCTCARG